MFCLPSAYSSMFVINKIHWCVTVCAINEPPRLVLQITPRSKLLMTLLQSSMPKPDIGRESQFLPTPPAFDAPVRRVPVGIFDMEKLEWCGYPMVKKVQGYFVCLCLCMCGFLCMDPSGLIQNKWMDGWLTRLNRIHERDRRTDRQADGRTDRMTALTALVHSSARQKAKHCTSAIYKIKQPQRPTLLLLCLLDLVILVLVLVIVSVWNDNSVHETHCRVTW